MIEWGKGWHIRKGLHWGWLVDNDDLNWSEVDVTPGEYFPALVLRV